MELGGEAVEHGQVIDINTINSFSPKRGANSIIPRNSLLGDIHIEQNLFFSTCQSMRREDLLENNFLLRDFINLEKTISEYRNYVKELLYLIKNQSSLFQRSDYRQIILGDLLPILIDTIPRQKSYFVPGSCLPQPSKSKLIRQATDFIHANLNKPLTLKDIYTHLGVSRRTLFYTFENIFGSTPMTYIKAQRLQGARRSLKQADPKFTNITSIAHQWGFYHLGHFTKAYQAMFNELPSQTLRVKRR